MNKSLCGFVSSVLSSLHSVDPLNNGDLDGLHTSKNARIFLISNSANNSKPKQTNNRKYISYSDTYDYKGETYKVNSMPTGIYTDMLRKVIGQFKLSRKLWGRVLVVRIDLHQSKFTENSKTVSWFFKSMVKRLKKQYSLEQVGYFWVREQERAKAQHYHCWLFLDGNRIKHSSNVIKMAKDVWVKNWAGNHHIPTTRKPFRLVDSKVTEQEVVYWFSYGCKGRGKGYRPPQCKDYGTSRLKVLS